MRHIKQLLNDWLDQPSEITEWKRHNNKCHRKVLVDKDTLLFTLTIEGTLLTVNVEETKANKYGRKHITYFTLHDDQPDPTQERLEATSIFIDRQGGRVYHTLWLYTLPRENMYTQFCLEMANALRTDLTFNGESQC